MLIARFSNSQFRTLERKAFQVAASGVTRVGVTRGGNWWMSPYFSWKNLTTFLIIASESDDLLSAVVSSALPSSHVVY